MNCPSSRLADDWPGRVITTDVTGVIVIFYSKMSDSHDLLSWTTILVIMTTMLVVTESGELQNAN